MDCASSAARARRADVDITMRWRPVDTARNTQGMCRPAGCCLGTEDSPSHSSGKEMFSAARRDGPFDRGCRDTRARGRRGLWQLELVCSHGRPHLSELTSPRVVSADEHQRSVAVASESIEQPLTDDGQAGPPERRDLGSFRLEPSHVPLKLRKEQGHRTS